MPRGKKEEEGSLGWLTTFGDMITLLFTFFVLVYSFSSYDPGEWQTAVGSIKGALSVVPGRMGNVATPGGGTGPFNRHLAVVELLEEMGPEESARQAFGEELAKVKQDAVSEMGIEGVELDETETGFVFRVETPFLFDMASADVRPSAEAFLEAIGHATHKADATISVAGHTCDLPISTTSFKSNWELSARRATNILRVIESVSSGRTRFVALARGQFDPLAPNDCEANRAKNRRVEIRLDLKGGLPFES
jgi:chemotaxis protein MotB